MKFPGGDMPGSLAFMLLFMSIIIDGFPYPAFKLPVIPCYPH